MAEVQLALQRGPGGFEKLVVIKLVHQKLVEQPTFVDMLLEEARMAALVKHPNVVDIYDLGQAEGRYYIAMEYLEGEPLLALLRAGRDGKRLDPLSTARLISGTAEGLDAAHELRSLAGDPIELVHHDVSLGNIVVLYNGQVKLVDFGVAKASQNAGPQMKVQGKFSYMAPEKLRGRGGDRRSDIWSLGCVLWESLTLRRLFKGSSDSDTVKQVLETTIRPPSQVNGDVPDDFDPIVMRALERDPARRYATAKELATDIEEVLRLHAYGGRNDLIARYMQSTFESHIAARKKLLQEVSSKGAASRDILEAAFAGSTVIDSPAYSEDRYRRKTFATPQGTPTASKRDSAQIFAERARRISAEMVAEGTPVEMPEEGGGLELTLQPLTFDEPPPQRPSRTTMPGIAAPPAPVPASELFLGEPAFGGDTQPRAHTKRLANDLFADSMPVPTEPPPVIMNDPLPPPRLARDSNPLGIGSAIGSTEESTDPGIEPARFASPSSPGVRDSGSTKDGRRALDEYLTQRDVSTEKVMKIEPPAAARSVRESTSGMRAMPVERSGAARSGRDSTSGMRSMPQVGSGPTRAARDSQQRVRNPRDSVSGMRPLHDPLRDSVSGMRPPHDPLRESGTRPPQTIVGRPVPASILAREQRDSSAGRTMPAVTLELPSDADVAGIQLEEPDPPPAAPAFADPFGPPRGHRPSEPPLLGPGAGIANKATTPGLREDPGSLADMINEPVVDLSAAFDDEAKREISMARSESLGRAIGDVLDRFGEEPRTPPPATVPPPVAGAVAVAPRAHTPSTKQPITTPKLTIKAKGPRTSAIEAPVVVVPSKTKKFLPFLIGALVGIAAVVVVLLATS
ncbi:MAG: protein kinase [Deltaproteobacteria bacterium]|nr:protein kinase [Deltaproteobacteria bacterium]